MKTGKELKIENINNYNVVFGSINNKNPKAIYINISSWGEPTVVGDVDYDRVIKNIRKKTKQTIYNFLDLTPKTRFKKEQTIIDFDIRKSGVKIGKRSFMSCEITLFLEKEIPANSIEMRTTLDELIPNITDKVFNENIYFKFNKRKK